MLEEYLELQSLSLFVAVPHMLLLPGKKANEKEKDDDQKHESETPKTLTSAAAAAAAAGCDCRILWSFQSCWCL